MARTSTARPALARSPQTRARTWDNADQHFPIAPNVTSPPVHSGVVPTSTAPARLPHANARSCR